ncbi:hypothetical protein DPX16_23704 [Anabarilius grahami]|uniref:Uncharacterized protein n=1 Tax=Anabarilius grahami TaxID=495550 RepID=A0A3N0Y494_ANAGA|nr:hypothetical protein DPX16_23704 [Anabarilius grahami]
MNQMMEEKMEETTKQISSLTSIIRDIEKQMKAEDVSFLQSFKATLQRAQYSLPDPDLSPSVMITFTDHLTNLKLSVLQKMQENFGKSELKQNAAMISVLFVLMYVYLFSLFSFRLQHQ